MHDGPVSSVSGYSRMHKSSSSFNSDRRLVEYFQVEFVEKMIKEAGVVAVPGCGFFHRNSSQSALSDQSRYIRFAFCKSVDTLSMAAERISGLVGEGGKLKLLF